MEPSFLSHELNQLRMNRNLSDIDVTTSADATENPGKCVEISMKPFSSKASSLATKKSETSAKKASRTMATAIKFKKAPGAPLRFKSAFIFFSTRKHKEIRSQLGKAGEKEKVSPNSRDESIFQSGEDQTEHLSSALSFPHV